MQPPKYKPGQVWAGVRTDKREVRTVQRRIILDVLRNGAAWVVYYTASRKPRRSTPREFRHWITSVGAKHHTTVRVPCSRCNRCGYTQEGGALSRFIECEHCKGNGYLGDSNDMAYLRQLQAEELHRDQGFFR